MIQVEAISKSFGTNQILHNVSFVARSGRITGFVGPNGAGKSTVLKTIVGLVRPDSGQVIVNGQAFFEQTPKPGSLMGVFLSAEWLPGSATAASMMNYICDLQGLPRSWATTSLESVGLAYAANQRIRTFSLGMRQRLGIAVATVGRPQILVMDEPINGLDPDGISWFRNFLKAQAENGSCVLLSSHHMAELAETADDIVMINHGKIVEKGSINDFVAHHEQISYYLESPKLDLLHHSLSEKGIPSSRHMAGLNVAHGSPTELAAIAVGSGAGISHLSRTSKSLEESYFALLASNDEGGTK